MSAGCWIDGFIMNIRVHISWMQASAGLYISGKGQSGAALPLEAVVKDDFVLDTMSWAYEQERTHLSQTLTRIHPWTTGLMDIHGTNSARHGTSSTS